jgi:CRISPR system Cascade subunit CasE
VLWRLDADGTHELNLYVVSSEVPSFDALVEQAGWTCNPAWRTADYDRFLERLEVGQRWVFRLLANPVRSVRTDDEGSAGRERLDRGRRVPLVKEPDQREWLASRSGGLGFALLPGASGGQNLRVTRSQRNRFERRSGSESRPVTLQSAQYDGMLEISDVDAMRRTLVAGVGSAKGYGCGLMTLAPPR